jgi:hypothetical protein
VRPGGRGGQRRPDPVFHDHDGRTAPRAAEVYRLLGARRHAAVVLHAVRDFLRVRPHFDAAGAQQSWDAFAGLDEVGKLEALTARFREIGRHQDTRALRIKLIRAAGAVRRTAVGR